MDIMDMLQGQLSEGLLDQLTQQIGAQDRQQTASAASGILSTLMGAMAKNAQKPGGAEALAGALDKDHDGSILDNLSDILGGSANTAGMERTLNGAGILKHILGERQSGAADMISQMSGLNSGQTGNLMATLAPIIMGALGKQKRQNNLDSGGIGDLLGSVLGAQQQQRKQNKNPMLDMIGSFLDKDGDGSIIDDAVGMLGNLLRKKR